ncbi:SRPBCC family protein [Dechloromonas sp. ZY10]|uniref:SRPBCC family protein n=1 Tax=Dechloromonas aquae TaxID=2664436 RepID=UPI00352927A2
MNVGRRAGFALAWCCMLGCLLALPAAALTLADDEVEVEYRDGTYYAHLQFRVAVPQSLALDVLTDFERMPAFIPGLEQSRVLAHAGQRWHVQQQGRLSFGPFRLNFANERLIEALPDGRIVAIGLSGVRKMRSELRTQASGSSTLLDYRLELLPEQWIPAGLGVNFMQHELAGQFSALASEMERRLQGKKH